jgi:hypothetical protein
MLPIGDEFIVIKFLMILDKLFKMQRIKNFNIWGTTYMRCDQLMFWISLN